MERRSVGELREIIEVPTVERWFAILAVAGPVVGLSIGAVVGARKGLLKRGATMGLCVGLLGTLNWILWRLYNALTNANGLDTVKNVLINLVVFVGIGAALGFGFGYARRFWQLPPSEEEGPALVGAGIGGPVPSGSSGAEHRIEEADEPPRNP
jgi:hypothetical protein